MSDLLLEAAKIRVAELVDLINQHRRAYYEGNPSMIQDIARRCGLAVEGVEAGGGTRVGEAEQALLNEHLGLADLFAASDVVIASLPTADVVAKVRPPEAAFSNCSRVSTSTNFTPVLRTKIMPQPGRLASGRISTTSVPYEIVSPT